MTSNYAVSKWTTYLLIISGGLLFVGENVLMAGALVEPEDVDRRDIIVISDLHMGLGYRNEASKEWYPSEDFRWPNALHGFLEFVSQEGRNKVDLVPSKDVGSYIETCSEAQAGSRS